jgi:small subunit ribosomal protein S16
LLRIRLRRTGKKKQPSYRIVVADSHAPRDGAFVESIGTYNPLNQPSVIVLDEERARHWLERGAQPSDRVSKILAIQGIAEIPSKLQTRIELGKKRADEAKNKPKEEASSEAPAAGAPTPAPAAEASANADVASTETPPESAEEAAAKESQPADHAATAADEPAQE